VSHGVTQSGQELSILLPQPVECWCYNHAPPQLAQISSFSDQTVLGNELPLVKQRLGLMSTADQTWHPGDPFWAARKRQDWTAKQLELESCQLGPLTSLHMTLGMLLNCFVPQFPPSKARITLVAALMG
jgi:hypothetical protein